MEQSKIKDVFIIGGGINGACIARDAVGRGLSVALCEKGDLSEGTSSRSGKLIHGGLRYLEYYEFRLVREALIEREVLLNTAAHIIWPMRLVIPHSAQQRPIPILRLGLFLYDHLGGRKRLPKTRKLTLSQASEGDAIKTNYVTAFEYSDCWVDDARLVLLNALDAAQKGAEIYTRMECISAKREGYYWAIQCKDTLTHETQQFYAKSVINAAGPWVDHVIKQAAQSTSKRQVRLVKGSHIVVDKFWEGSQAYVLQNEDKRLIFVNPYEGGKALIGTTDIPYTSTIEDVAIGTDEIEYLLNAVNLYFKKQLKQNDVISSFSGVRPLFDDGKGNPSAVTRDYVIEVDDKESLPLINIFGGKITTARKLAESVIEKINPYFNTIKPNWTEYETLPGGDFKNADFTQFYYDMQEKYAWLPENILMHYLRLYGTLTDSILSGCNKIEDLGHLFGSTFYQVEVEYLIKNEWAKTPEDILLRRTKHGLHLTEQESTKFNSWFYNYIN